jgi:hypothetical protein
MYISGNDITAAAITVAGQEKTTDVWNNARNLPIQPCFPMDNNRPKPTTVGGNTSGRMKAPSITGLNFPLYLDIQRAAAIPSTKVIAVVTSTVFKEIHKGDKYSFIKPTC